MGALDCFVALLLAMTNETNEGYLIMTSTNPLDPIPHPPKKPVVGNMLSIDSTAPVQNLTQLAKELGPIYWLDMMGTPMVVVSGHDLVEELSDEKRFDKSVRGSLRRRTTA